MFPSRSVIKGIVFPRLVMFFTCISCLLDLIGTYCTACICSQYNVLWLANSSALFSYNAHRPITSLQKQKTKKPPQKTKKAIYTIINNIQTFGLYGKTSNIGLAILQHGKVLFREFPVQTSLSVNKYQQLTTIKKMLNFVQDHNYLFYIDNVSFSIICLSFLQLQMYLKPRKKLKNSISKKCNSTGWVIWITLTLIVPSLVFWKSRTQCMNPSSFSSRFETTQKINLQTCT